MKSLHSAYPVLTCQQAAQFEASVLVDEAAAWKAMQAAGVGLANALCLDYQELRPLPQGLRVLALIGKGHNGGDALIACGQLLANFPRARVTLILAADPEALNPAIVGALQPLRGVRGILTRDELCSMFVNCLETLADSRQATPTYMRPVIEEIEVAHGNVRLGELESRLGISERQFRRQFQRFVGMTPKTFCRTLQVNAALSALLARSERKLPELAVEFGFADQSHMIRAFAEFMGTSPTRLLEDLEPTLARFVGQSRSDSTSKPGL